MTTSKINFRHILIEAVLIVFTVSLALALSEWRQQTKKDALVDRVITSLKSEAEKNVKSLDSAIEYHGQLLKELYEDKHVLLAASFSELNFNPASDIELISFIKGQLYTSSVFSDPIQVIRHGGSRYLRMDDKLSTIITQNDSLFVYGKDNIILRHAAISNNSWQIAQATNVLIELDYDLINKLGQITSEYEDYKSTTEMAMNILYTGSGSVQSAIEDLYTSEKKLLKQYQEVLSNLNK